MVSPEFLPQEAESPHFPHTRNTVSTKLLVHVSSPHRRKSPVDPRRNNNSNQLIDDNLKPQTPLPTDRPTPATLTRTQSNPRIRSIGLVIGWTSQTQCGNGRSGLALRGRWLHTYFHSTVGLLCTTFTRWTAATRYLVHA